jgi:hypothetical protein
LFKLPLGSNTSKLIKLPHVSISGNTSRHSTLPPSILGGYNTSRQSILPFAIAGGDKATWQFRLSFTTIRKASKKDHGKKDCPFPSRNFKYNMLSND